MIRCTIVCGGDPTTREAAIATRLDPHHGAAVIIEGARAATPQLPLPGTPALSSLINIVPDCPCCGTALILRVTLDRVLRQRAPVLFLSLDASTHASHVATLLQSAPYAAMISLQPLLDCGSSMTPAPVNPGAN
jgi:hypothetical protein